MPNHRTTSQHVRLTTDSLIQNAYPRLTGTGSRKLKRLLRQFAKHFHRNPELVPYLIKQLRSQVRSEGWASFDLAFANALLHLETPGGADYKLPHQLKSLYVRVILRCVPELNGHLELRYCNADMIFGSTIATKKLSCDFGRRLIWPSDLDYVITPTETEPEPEAQGELFDTEAA